MLNHICHFIPTKITMIRGGGRITHRMNGEYIRITEIGIKSTDQHVKRLFTSKMNTTGILYILNFIEFLGGICILSWSSSSLRKSKN